MVRKGLSKRGFNRKGLSDVVVTVLLILLVVAAIAIIWGFISTFLRSTDKIDTNTLNTALSIQAKSVMINWNGTLSFNAKMDSGESVDRVQITLYDNSGNTKMIYRNVSFQKLEVKNFYIPVEEHGFVNIAKIEIVPVIETQTGLQVGTMQGEYNINQLDVVQPGCGDGIANGAEQCDNGTSNGVIPGDIAYNANSSYCDLSCHNVIVRGPYCGDAACNSGENSNSCYLDCGSICNDGYLNGAEECESGNLNGSSCSSKGYLFGTLNCSLSCKFDTSQCLVSTSELTAFYKFDESSYSGSAGDVKDFTGRNNGTSYGSLSSTSGKVGNAASFNGNGQYVKIPSLDGTGSDFSKNYSVSAWIKTNAPSLATIYSKTNPNYWCDGGDKLLWLSGNALDFQDCGGGGDWRTSYNIPSNAWIQVALTYNAITKTLTFYVNGTVIQTYSSYNRGLDPTSSIFRIGRYANGAQGDFKGLMDNFMLFNRTLSDAEINAIFNNQ